MLEEVWLNSLQIFCADIPNVVASLCSHKVIGITIHPTVLPVFDSVGVISTVRKERAVEAKA